MALKAVVLGAGLGTRLAPLTVDTPKILITVRGKPLLEHQINYLAAQGITAVTVNSFHHADRVERFVQSGRFPIAVAVSREPYLRGTAGALVQIKSWLDGTFLVLYGDVVTNLRLEDLLDAHRTTDADATLAYHVSEGVRSKGVMTLDAHGTVVGFTEKPLHSAGAAHVNAGIYVLEPTILEYIQGRAPDFGHDVWPSVIRGGGRLASFRVDSYVKDVGTLADFRTFVDDLESGSLTW